MDGFSCFKTAKPLQGKSSLFTTKSPLILLTERRKGELTLEPPGSFELGALESGIQYLNY